MCDHPSVRVNLQHAPRSARLGDHHLVRKKKEFGPNQEQVDALLERLETLNQFQALHLASIAYEDPARTGARKSMVDSARSSGRAAELDRAQQEVMRWMNLWFSGGFQIVGYGRDISPAEAAVNASPVVLDAVGALVMRDLLSAETFETLIGPWRELDAPD